MRKSLAALAIIPLASGCGLFVASGPALLPYNGHTLHSGEEARLGLAVSPNWAIAIASHSAHGDSGGVFQPTCSTGPTGCYPKLGTFGVGFETEYRWNPARQVHPVVSVALGKTNAEYTYRSKYTSTCKNQYCSAHADSAQAATFATFTGGGELNLGRWFHLSLLAGYRPSFGSPAPERFNSGFTLTSFFTMGKPYRDP
jgi:hypothetical protein